MLQIRQTLFTKVGIVLSLSIVSGCASIDRISENMAREAHQRKIAEEKRLSNLCADRARTSSLTHSECIELERKKAACLIEVQEAWKTCSLKAYGGTSSLGSPAIQPRRQACDEARFKHREQCEKLYSR